MSDIAGELEQESQQSPPNPVTQCRSKRSKENRARRAKKKLRVDDSTEVKKYFNSAGEESSSVESRRPILSNQEQSERSSSTANSLLCKSDLSYSEIYLSFKNAQLDTKYQKYSSYSRPFFTTLCWVAFPYFLVNVSILSVNVGSVFQMTTFAIVLCSLLQLINLVTMSTYLLYLYFVHSDMNHHRDSSVNTDDLNRMETADNPYLQHLPFQEVSKFDNLQSEAHPQGKAIMLQRLSLAFATSTLVMIGTWCILMAAYKFCPGFCVNNVPSFGIFFLWIIPFHFSVFTCIRGFPAFILELLSKFIVYFAFLIQFEGGNTSNEIVFLVITFLLWIGFWLPLIYSCNRQQLQHFYDIEAFHRIIKHYELRNSPNSASIFERYDETSGRNDLDSLEAPNSANQNEIDPAEESPDVLEMDEDSCFQRIVEDDAVYLK